MSWNETTLGEVVTLNYGIGLPAKKRKLGNIPVYGSNGVVGTHDKAFVRCPGIIVGRKGSVGAVHISHKGFCAIDTTYYITPKDTSCDLHFLYYLLIHTNLSRLVSDLVPGLNRDLAYSQSAIIPSMHEQQKIATLLSAIQRVIEQQERLIVLTTELKKALMHKLFTEGTFGEKQKQTEIGPVPESWDIVPIGGLGTCVTGSTPRTAVKENYCPPERDFIAPADLGHTKYIYESERQISIAGLATVRPLPRNSVLCVCIGSSLGKTGMTYKVDSCTNQQINAIICNETNNADYVYYLLTYHSDYWRSHATFGTVPILSKGRFCQVRVPYTSNRAEQDDIASALMACDEKIEYHMSKSRKYQELFKIILHQLMTAQIRVNNLDLNELDYEPITTGREEVI